MIWVAVAILAVGFTGLIIWHRNWWLRFRAGWSDEAGWRKLRPAEYRDGRACPGCKAGVYGWRDQAHHELVCEPFQAYARADSDRIKGQNAVRAEVLETMGRVHGDGAVDTMLPGPDDDDG